MTEENLSDRYVVTLVVPLEYEVRGSTIGQAAAEARRVLAMIREKHPAAKILRLMSDVTYVALDPVVEPTGAQPPTPPAPRGSPVGGGSPGTPVISAPVMTDAVAKVS
jgi:hypothetical protein